VAQVNDLSRSLTAFDPISTLVVVVEMSKASWLVSGVLRGARAANARALSRALAHHQPHDESLSPVNWLILGASATLSNQTDMTREFSPTAKEKSDEIVLRPGFETLG
jgi:hypothetical protein